MVVYKITNTINNKVYYGITKCTINKRWSEHKSKSKSGKSHLSLAIKKYGASAFKIEIVNHCSSENEMYELEIYLIQKHKSNNPIYGYNNSCGGEVSSSGKKLSLEQRNKISKYQKGRKRKPHSSEAKSKMSLSAKGRDMSKLILNSVKKRKGNLSHNICKVYKYDLDGTLIEDYASLTLAAKSVNGVVSAFSALKSGKLKTYKNYKWKFEN